MSARGFCLRVHPAGLAALLLALVFGRSHVALAAVLALLWHEGAHVLAMLLCGVSRCEVELTPFGGMADATDYERLSAVRQLVIALSGVAASALLGWACLRYAPVAPFWYALACLNLSLALINCLPVWPLDGARAVLALASKLGCAPAALRVMRFMAYALAVALVALGLYGAWRGHVNLSLLLIGPYLCYAARQSAVSGGVRLMRQAHDIRRKLENGMPMPTRAYVCRGEPDQLTMARMLRRAPSERYHLLHIVDENGAVTDTLSEQQLADRLFDNL